MKSGNGNGNGKSKGSLSAASSKATGKSESRTPSSRVQIKALDASRPKPTSALDYTPSGTTSNELAKEAARKRNAQIDKQVTAMDHRLKKLRGRSKKEFVKTKEGLAKIPFDRKGKGPSR